MKGIILAGNQGMKLHPLTLGVPKQLLPVYDKPMIFYPIETMAEAGIVDILIITSPEHEQVFRAALGDGESFGTRFTYAIQSNPDGTAQAFTIAEDFIASEPVCMMTGDCIIIGKDRAAKLKKAWRAAANSGQSTIFVHGDRDTEQYGVVTLNQQGKIAAIEGKPTMQRYYSITGMYVFPKGVSDYARELTRSERGRYEVTSLNQLYHGMSKLRVQRLGEDFIWLDTNTFDNILKANNFIQRLRKTTI